ncbi:MAG: AMP-binding protein [Solirubrobacteraceae bacterium]
MSGSGPVQYVGVDGRGTVADVLRARAALTPDATFVSFDGTVITFAGMVGRAERAAGALAGLGMRPGDRVATVLPNSLELLDVWMGAAVGGFVLVPVNTGLKGEGLRYILEHSESKVVVVDGPLADTLAAAVPADAGPRIRLTRGVPDAEGLTAADVLAAGAPAGGNAGDPSGLATILYTSGTTGLPKGVMNGHRPYLTAGVEFTRRFLRLGQDDVLYTTLPLFHVNAQMLSVMGAIVSGRPLVLAPRFSASRFFDDIRDHRATVFNYIGAMLTMLHKQPVREHDADNPIRVAVGGAAPKELWRDFERRFGLEILEVYGLTETACFCLGSPPDAIKPGKLGKAVSWAEVDVQRDDGTTTDDGEPGEIVVRPRPKQEDTLFRGYLKNDEATAKAMRDGWFLTGDRGRRDDDGYLVFLDRLKDVIRRRGENISSYEVERAANLHDDVAESAAVGVPSELGEEDVMIVVVPRDGATIDPAGIRAHCAEQLAAFMVPRYVLVRDALPKTATQRVQKFELRKTGHADAWDAEAVGTRA